MISIFSVISFIIYTTLCMCVAVLVWKPQLVANIIIRNYPSQLYSDASDAEYVEHEYRDSKVYTYNDTGYEPGSPVIIYLNGGMFVMMSPELRALQEFTHRRRLVTFTHPVRFDAETRDIVEYIRDLIVNYIPTLYAKDPPKEYFIVAHSAGAFYAILMIRLINGSTKHDSSNMYISRFIGINGFYGSSTTKFLMFKLLSVGYVEKDLPTPVPLSIASYTDRIHVLTNTDDFIRDSSEAFAHNNGASLRVMPGDHTSLYTLSKPESVKMFEYLNELILES